MFKSDFKIVAKYFQTIRLKNDYEGSNEIIIHVDETLKMLSAITGDNSFETVYNNSEKLKNGGVTMCEMIQKIRNEGKEEIIIKMLESNILTIEQIASITQLPVEKIKEISTKVSVLN